MACLHRHVLGLSRGGGESLGVYDEAKSRHGKRIFQRSPHRFPFLVAFKNFGGSFLYCHLLQIRAGGILEYRQRRYSRNDSCPRTSCHFCGSRRIYPPSDGLWIDGIRGDICASCDAASFSVARQSCGGLPCLMGGEQLRCGCDHNEGSRSGVLLRSGGRHYLNDILCYQRRLYLCHG